GGLRGAVERTRMQKQPAAQATVVANPVDVDGEGLSRMDTHVKVEAAAAEHARGIRIALDLAVDVVGGAGELPRRRAGFLILGDDRIVSPCYRNCAEREGRRQEPDKEDGHDDAFACHGSIVWASDRPRKWSRLPNRRCASLSLSGLSCPTR